MPSRLQIVDWSVTTLAADASAGATSITVASTTGQPTAPLFYVRVGTPVQGTRPNASVEWHSVTAVAGAVWTLGEALAIDHAAGDEVAPILNASALKKLVGVYEGGTLVDNGYELDFDGDDFDVSVANGRASIALTPSATPVVGNDSIWDAKGDLAAGTGADAAARLAVGTDGQILVADSTQATGIKWDTPAAGASFAAPTGSIDLGDSNTEGVAVTTVRSDHTHAFPAPGAGYPQDVAVAENDGTATTPARSDHVHAHGTGYLPDAHHARSHDHSNASDGTSLAPGALDVTAGPVKLSGDISPAQLTASQNDWNPTGLATATVIRASSDASRTITGLAGGADGRVLVLCNVGSQDLVLADESASSTAANRFALDQSLTLGADTAATLLYDATAARWRLVGLGKTVGAGGTGNVATDPIWVAKGDLAAGTGVGTAARTGSGANGTLLTADSAQPAGVKWATLAHSATTGQTTDDHHAKAHDHTTGDGSGVLTNDEHDGYSQFAELGADPATPAANKLRLYAKDRSGETFLYYISDAGAIYELPTLKVGGGGGGSTGAPAGASYVTTAAESGLSAEQVLGTAVIMAGVAGSRPAFGTAGRLYFATDTDGGTLYRDTGTAWVQIAQGLTATPPSHTHAEADVTSLTTDLAAKLAKTGGTADHPTVSDYVDLTDQGGDPSSPSAGAHRVYAKAGGLYVKDSGGTVVGALGAGGASALDDLSDVAITAAADGQFLQRVSGTFVNAYQYEWITFVIDGGGSAIATGIKGDFRVPAGTIVAASLLADQSGSIVVDLWKDSRANFPPTVADTITASAKPSLSSATNSEDTTLTGWTATTADGDVIRVNVDSAATVTRVSLSLKLRR